MRLDYNYSFTDEIYIEKLDKNCKLDMRYNNIMFCNDILKSKIDPYEKLVKFLINVFEELEIEDISKLEWEDMDELSALVLNYIFNFGEKEENNGKKIFDFKQDWNYIDASFLSEYGIDLYKEKIHWFLFYNRFSSLSKTNKLSEVIEIRTMEIPKRDKYNGKTIENIKKAKKVYALELDEEDRKKEDYNKAKQLFDSW